MRRRESWVAVRDKSVADVLSDLPFQPVGPSFVCTGKLMPNVVSCIEGHDGWFVVSAGGHPHPALTEGDAMRISRGAAAMYFQCDDETMVTSIASFTDGRKTWELTYSGLDGVDPEAITVFGAPPKLVEKAIAEALRELDEHFEPDPPDVLYGIAPAIGQTLTGYHHDHDVPGLRVQELREL